MGMESGTSCIRPSIERLQRGCRVGSGSFPGSEGGEGVPHDGRAQPAVPAGIRCTGSPGFRQARRSDSRGDAQGRPLHARPQRAIVRRTTSTPNHGINRPPPSARAASPTAPCQRHAVHAWRRDGPTPLQRDIRVGRRAASPRRLRRVARAVGGRACRWARRATSRSARATTTSPRSPATDGGCTTRARATTRRPTSIESTSPQVQRRARR